MFAQQTESPIYQASHHIRTSTELMKIHEGMVDHIITMTNLTQDDALLLLYFFRWNLEKLVEAYLDSPGETLKKAGARTEKSISVLEFMQCNICLDDCESSKMAGASCGHKFCRSCFSYYLNSKTKENYVPHEDLLVQTFVRHSTFLKWCAAPDCNFVIECHILKSDMETIVPTVHCQCGYSMCFGCDMPNHEPVTCLLARSWLTKSKEDNESVNWIANNTKDCAYCHTAIEKNGGCNHMTCWKCRHQFCWICLKSWNHHNQTACSRYLDNTEDRKSAVRCNIERYLHYYNRYVNHEQSAKLEKAAYAETEQKMIQLQLEGNFSWNETQFIKHAVDTVVRCRNTLKWTYAFAYYLKQSNEKALFEDNQEDFEIATEQLSELLEQPINKENSLVLRQVIIDKTVYVTQRQRVLLDHASQGLQDGIWLFDFDTF
ncbi:hypothetical protein BD560DRAFT_483946 [Blakeslea trispora]|nr:hypothetical protein BD560DRAFT_483946 [Blakeslea trispora]